MTSLANVILEPFGPERASRAGSAKGKNLNSRRVLARKSQHDPLPTGERERVSRDTFREVASAITRLRGKPMDSHRLAEWAARLEAHPGGREFLATRAVADGVEPAFEATPLGVTPPPFTAPAGLVGPTGGFSTVAEQPTDLAAQVRTPARGGFQTVARGDTLPAPARRDFTMALTAVIPLLRSRQLSALELVEEHLERIRQAPGLNAFIAVFEEQARCEAG